MEKEEIKSLEDALSFIADLEEIQNNKTIEIDGLNAKMKEMDTSIKKITEENKELKERCYDLFMKIPRQQEDKKQEEVKKVQSKSLDDLLLED